MDRGDERPSAGSTGHRRVDAGQVGQSSVDLRVAVRVGALDRAVPRRGKGRAGQAQRVHHPPGDFMPPRPAGGALDDQAQQVVVGVRVLVAGSGREHRRMGGGEIEDLVHRPHLLGMVGDVFVLGFQVPFRDPAPVAEQHANRDVGRRREAIDDVRGQHLGEPRVQRQPAALGQLQDDDRDERLHDAAGAEPITRAHRYVRPHPAETRRVGEGAESRAPHVQDRAGSVKARIGECVA